MYLLSFLNIRFEILLVSFSLERERERERGKSPEVISKCVACLELADDDHAIFFILFLLIFFHITTYFYDFKCYRNIVLIRLEI